MVAGGASIRREKGEAQSDDAARASALVRGLAILDALGSDEALDGDGLGVVRIAELVGREKSQVSRAMQTLARAGFVEREADSRRYRLGWRLFALGARAGDARLLHAAAPVLTDLVAHTGETAHLSVLDGGEVLTLLSEGPATAVRASGWQGRRVPASCTSSGRALLFDHSARELEQRFAGGDLPHCGPNAVRSLAELHERVLRDRSSGVAVSDEEFEVGLMAVAAPVRNARGSIVAAVNVSAPKFRLDAHLDLASRQVLSAAVSLSSALGNRPALRAAVR